MLQTAKKRLSVLDSLRGLTLVSMIAYHASWDLVYLFGVRWEWYRGTGAFVWQQSICWTFILLSGFCWPLGHRPLKRGALVFAAGLVVTATTLVFSPSTRVVFGVLTLLGSSMLLQTALAPLLRKLPAWAGLIGSFGLFGVFRWVNRGYLWFGPLGTLPLPKALYRGLAATFVGFPDPGFFSTDYFSLLPWYFLFAAGYFMNRLWADRLRQSPLAGVKLPVLDRLGRHSLIVYLLHQPVIYALLSVWDRFFR